MKTLKFRSELIDQILKETKRSTWRLFDDKDLKVGDVFHVIDSETLKDYGEAIIKEIKEKKLGDITDDDFEGHEKYKDQDDMLRHYRKYYGDRVNLNTMVKMIKFDLTQ